MNPTELEARNQYLESANNGLIDQVKQLTGENYQLRHGARSAVFEWIIAKAGVGTALIVASVGAISWVFRLVVAQGVQRSHLGSGGRRSPDRLGHLRLLPAGLRPGSSSGTTRNTRSTRPIHPHDALSGRHCRRGARIRPRTPPKRGIDAQQTRESNRRDRGGWRGWNVLRHVGFRPQCRRECQAQDRDYHQHYHIGDHQGHRSVQVHNDHQASRAKPGVLVSLICRNARLASWISGIRIRTSWPARTSGSLLTAT